MSKREKIAATPIILGMVAICCDSIPVCIVGVVLFAIGALILNVGEGK